MGRAGRRREERGEREEIGERASKREERMEREREKAGDYSTVWPEETIWLGALTGAFALLSIAGKRVLAGTGPETRAKHSWSFCPVQVS